MKKIYTIAIFYLAAMMAIATTPVFSQNNNADELFEKGLRNLNTGDFNQAVIDFTQAIALDPKSPEARYNRGAAKANMFAKKNPLERSQAMLTGRSALVEEALADFTKAIELDANNPQFYAARGCAYIFIRKTKEAITDIDKALSMDDTQANLYFHRGIARILSADFKGAWSDIDKSKKMGFEPPKEAGEQLKKLR